MASRAGSWNGRLETSTAAGASVRSRAGWQEFSERFPDDRDCLASFLVLEGAEVLEGEKPANLISIANRRRSCGRNLYQLWKKHGGALLRESGLKVKELADRGSSILLLLYRAGELAQLLARKSVAVILGKVGYTPQADTEKTLAELQERLAGGSFPHEVGVFLGYPLKDVIGFMGWARLPFTCQGPWKIFGDPRESLRLAEAHRQCRSRLSRKLASVGNPREFLRADRVAAVSGKFRGSAFLSPCN